MSSRLTNRMISEGKNKTIGVSIPQEDEDTKQRKI